MLEKFKSKEFVAFLITGGIAAAINFGSRIIYNHWMSFSSAIVLAYVTGMITAFILAKNFVFKSSSQKLRNSALLFIAVNVIAVMQTWLVSLTLLNYVLPLLGIKIFCREISHAFGVVVPVFTSYIGHKMLTFR